MVTRINETGQEEQLSIKAEHRNLERQVARLQQMAGALPSVLATERPKIYQRLVDGFKRYLQPHAEWEERVLYPLADGKVNSEDFQVTAALRVEHQIMERWIDDLEKMLVDSHPDPDDFSIKTQQLIGLVKAHFEVEEAIIIPLVEQ